MSAFFKNEYEKMIYHIVHTIGDYYSFGEDYDGSNLVQYSYAGYGIKVVMDDMGNFFNTYRVYTETPDGYNNLVFDTKNRVYEPGIWEKILITIHNKRNIIKENDTRIKTFLNQVIKPIIDYKIGNVSDTLIVRKRMVHTSNMTSTGSIEDDEYYEVIENGNIVFQSRNGEYSTDVKILQYTTGTWETALEIHLDDYRYNKKLKDNELKLKYQAKLINHLGNLNNLK